MTLIEKLSGKWKKLSKAAVLAGAISTVATGCTSVGPWIETGRDYVRTGIEKKNRNRC